MLGLPEEHACIVICEGEIFYCNIITLNAVYRAYIDGTVECCVRGTSNIAYWFPIHQVGGIDVVIKIRVAPAIQPKVVRIIVHQVSGKGIAT